MAEGQRILLRTGCRSAIPLGLAVVVVILMGTVIPSVGANRTLSFIHLSGKTFVNDQGKTVYLDGVNYKDQLNWYLFEQDANPAKAADWPSIQHDFASMASMGAKTVRVWFDWINYEREPGTLDSSRLVSDIGHIVDIASQNGLYVIITIYVYGVHIGSAYKKVATNWLQADATTSHTDPNSTDFWLNDGDSPVTQRELFVHLWLTISSNFKNDPTVLMYDLLNEPYNKYYDVLPMWAQNEAYHDQHYPLKSVYDEVVSVIRANGDRHLILLDYNDVDQYVTFPIVLPSSDSQVLYDVHLYYTAPGTPTQGWDQVSRVYGPWRGNTADGKRIQYTYPDFQSNHDINGLRGRFEDLAKLNQYVFYIGEFGFTENTAYSLDVAKLSGQFNLPGLAYFEYVPAYASYPAWSSGPVGSLNVTQTVLASARPGP